jgi:Planctomycete cytochrome C
MPASLLWLVFSLPGQPPSGAAIQPPDFQREVLPILRDNCFKCHSHQAGKNKGGVVLDSRAALREPGDSGHKPIEVFLPAIRREKPIAAMPPGKPLDKGQIATLTRWVEAGTPWPGTDQKSGLPARAKGQVSQEDRQWWAVQPLKTGNLKKNSSRRPRKPHRRIG